MFHDNAKVIISQVTREGISPEKALESALAIEHDLIERRFFEVYESDSPELKIILESLDSSTKEHRRRLAEALEAHKRTRSRP